MICEVLKWTPTKLFSVHGSRDKDVLAFLVTLHNNMTVHSAMCFFFCILLIFL